MGALMRAYDWGASPLWPADRWPQSLRTAVRILLTTQHPMFIWWGPDLVQFYNDAYRQTMGPERHPSALGQRGKDCWQEIWDIIGPQIETVMRGEGATWHENQLVPVTRHGKREDVWWTYGFSPIDDEDAPNRSRNSMAWIPANCGPELPTEGSSSSSIPTTGIRCAGRQTKRSKQGAI
jgi:hypothetical protein